MNKISPSTGNIFLDRVINKFFGESFEIKYLNQFFEGTSRPISINKTKDNILIYAGIGHMYHTPIEVLFYHLLIDRGFNVDYCIYDNKIPANEVITREVIKKVGKNKFWNRSVRNAKRFLKYSNVDYEFIEYSSKVDHILNDSKGSLEKILDFEYDGIMFGKIVESVLFRFYKSFSFDKDVLTIAEKFMYTALTNYFHFKRKLSQKKYKYVMFSHGIYCTWGPISKYCENIKQDYICYDRAKTDGCYSFNLNKPAPVWDISDAWARLENYRLNSFEVNKVDKYIAERELQEGDVYSYNHRRREKDLNLLRNKLGIKDNAKIITIFTNLIWDAANVSRDIAFKSALDCIVETIDKYKNNMDFHILIRPHPAEQVLGTNERYEDLILKKFNDELPSNVTIIKNEMEINSFSVIDLSDVGIVNTSTVGLEMAIEGKPIILISETHYRNKGFTYDAFSEDNYFELIDSILDHGHKMPKQIELAKKYFYLMMFEYQHKLPIKTSSINTFDGYGHNDFKSLKFDKNEKINLIIDGITSEDFNDFIFRG